MLLENAPEKVGRFRVTGHQNLFFGQDLTEIDNFTASKNIHLKTSSAIFAKAQNSWCLGSKMDFRLILSDKSVMQVAGRQSQVASSIARLNTFMCKPSFLSLYLN